MEPLISQVPAFVELLAKSNYSFLEGASHPEEMVTAAKLGGLAGMGIVDRLGVYGAPRAHTAAKASGLPLIIGAEVILDGSPLWLLARNRNGYGNLCELLTTAHEDRDNPHVTLEQLCDKAADLFLLSPGEAKWSDVQWGAFREAFGTHQALVASRFLDGGDTTRLASTLTAARRWDLMCVASNRPLFHEAARKPLQDVLTCIRHTRTLKEGGLLLLPNAERYLKGATAMQALFADHPEWLTNTLRVAEQCQFSLDEIRYRYPTEWIPEGETGNSYLARLTWEGAEQRYGSPLPAKVQELLQHELALISELEYSDYFLTIWDIVRFARSQNILCQGRGSAANSIVCYVLGITSIDPAHLKLLFERFISRERREPPDIDIDFEHERREEVIQYIYKRYGRHRAAITATVICYRKRSALREVAKVFEIPVQVIERLQMVLHRRSFSDLSPEELQTNAPGQSVRKLRQYYCMVQSILTYPRHLGTHVGGFVLCQEALTRNVPIEKAAMDGRTIVQWDKNDLDALGFVRVDILGLGILTAIRKSFTLLKATRGIDLTLATIPQEDPKVYEPLWRGDSVGIFQIESRAQMNMLPRLKPRNFYDLVVEISLVRPGPIQGDMVHPYLKRRMGQEPIEYAHPALKDILEKTYGVPLFQEQIMKMAMVVAGFSAGEADQLRRAMGSWRRDGANKLAALRERFRDGLLRSGVSLEYAERVYSQIEGFAEYGFPESHAASFAVLVYATAYLKCHYPDVFLVGLLNAQPMGFYSAHSLLYDGMRHGVQVAPMDANLSYWDHTLDSVMHLRMGFREIRGLREAVGGAIEKAREGGIFFDFEDFLNRVSAALLPLPLTKRDLFLLAGANTFACLGLERRDAYWKIQALAIQDSFAFNAVEEKVALPEESTWEKITADYDSQRVCIDIHPMAYFRADLKCRKVTPSPELPKLREGTRVKVAGIAICRQQPPTASGVLFITLEDEFGFINLVIWKKIFEQYREPLLTQSFLECEGRVQRDKSGGVLHVIVDKAGPLLHVESTPQVTSHDFH